MKIKKNIRVAIIGYGSIGKRHLNIIQKLVKKEKIIVFTRKKIINNEIKFTNDLKEIIKFKPEISIICNAANDHIGKAQTLIKVSSKIFIEKPLSDSSKKIINFLKVWKKNKKPIIIGYNLRYFNSLIYFKKLIERGNIGKIHHVKIEAGSNLINWRKNVNYSNSVSAQKKLGGGVLFELSHEIDYLRWIFGDPDYLLSNVKKLSNLNINAEDTASIIFDYKKKKMLINLFMNFFQKNPTRNCVVIGSKTSAKWDLLKNNVSIYDLKNKKWKLKKFKKNNISNTYKKEIRDLLFMNTKKNKTYKSLIFNIDTIKLIEAIKKSSNDNKKIKFK